MQIHMHIRLVGGRGRVRQIARCANLRKELKPLHTPELKAVNLRTNLKRPACKGAPQKNSLFGVFSVFQQVEFRKVSSRCNERANRPRPKRFKGRSLGRVFPRLSATKQPHGQNNNYDPSGTHQKFESSEVITTHSKKLPIKATVSGSGNGIAGL